MALSMNEVKELYQAACENELPEFIQRFSEDERSGVKKLVDSAQKRLLALEKEKQRIYELQRYEREYSQYEYICGIDEVGRGPVAGPVVAGAVILPKDCDILYINDSKKLSEKREKSFMRKLQAKLLLGESV